MGCWIFPLSSVGMRRSSSRSALATANPWSRSPPRSIVQPEFIALLARKLNSGGVLRMASDWQPYAEHMLATVGGCGLLRNESATGDYVVRPDSRPPTRFERRGQRLGHGVWDLAFRRI